MDKPCNMFRLSPIVPRCQPIEDFMKNINTWPSTDNHKQGCEWEFKKRAVIVPTKKMAWKHTKRHIFGISRTIKKLKSALKLNSHTVHPCTSLKWGCPTCPPTFLDVRTPEQALISNTECGVGGGPTQLTRGYWGCAAKMDPVFTPLVNEWPLLNDFSTFFGSKFGKWMGQF